MSPRPHEPRSLAVALRITFEPALPHGPGWRYRATFHDGASEAGPLRSLEDLAAVLQRWGHGLEGLPWAELPTFGGAPPRETAGVWSWDATRLLVGDRPDAVRLLPRLER
ncbi:hypothetical protein [Corallococcus sp. RDP092CA]|uniref:hypothetical protein n=1 Tax=Corallococcus sp. RDP092CA TaxID=3109369 RepID=UPI0035B16D7C